MPPQKQALPADALPENARIVQASFLQKASHQVRAIHPALRV
jgi:hypothetical protein